MSISVFATENPQDIEPNNNTLATEDTLSKLAEDYGMTLRNARNATQYNLACQKSDFSAPRRTAALTITPTVNFMNASGGINAILNF